MTEPTTLEKIEQMLAWLHEGRDLDGETETLILRSRDEHPVEPSAGQRTVYTTTGRTVAVVYGCGRCEGYARNIAALLNGIRPALEAAREAFDAGQWEYQREVMEITEDIINPLYAAFMEARDG